MIKRDTISNFKHRLNVHIYSYTHYLHMGRAMPYTIQYNTIQQYRPGQAIYVRIAKRIKENVNVCLAIEPATETKMHN